MKIAPEGFPFIAGTLLFAVFASFIYFLYGKSESHPYLSYTVLGIALFSFLLAGFMFFFFRDPERVIPEGKEIVVAPADGKVILIREVFEDTYLKSNMKEVSIFMSPLDVHVNRSPCDGKVTNVVYKPGRFVAAYRDDASLKNEHISIVLETEWGNMLVRQVAGSVARRAVCRAKVGDSLKRGQRFGIIKFSSRVDIFLPKDISINVKKGDRVKAGETIIGGFL